MAGRRRAKLSITGDDVSFVSRRLPLLKGRMDLVEQQGLAKNLAFAHGDQLRSSVALIYGYLRARGLGTDLITFRFVDMIVAHSQGGLVRKLVQELLTKVQEGGVVARAYGALLSCQVEAGQTTLAAQLSEPTDASSVVFGDVQFVCDGDVVFLVRDGRVGIVPRGCVTRIFTICEGFRLELKSAPLVGDWKSEVTWDNEPGVTMISSALGIV